MALLVPGSCMLAVAGGCTVVVAGGAAVTVPVIHGNPLEIYKYRREGFINRV